MAEVTDIKKELIPFHERVNIPSKLKAIRDILRVLEEKKTLTPAEALKKQRLKNTIADIIRNNVYLVSDNKEIDCPDTSLTSKQKD